MIFNIQFTRGLLLCISAAAISDTVFGAGKPECNKKSNPKVFYELGEMCSFECHIHSNSSIDVEWYFQKSPKYPILDDESLITRLPRNMYEIKTYNKDKPMSVICITANETGTLYCNSTNVTSGNSNQGFRLLLTDVPNGLAINGPQTIVDGDDITIECRASVYIFTRYINWFYEFLNGTSQPITTNNYTNTLITNNKTALSYSSFLTITNITNKFNGNYLCVPSESYPDAPTEAIQNILKNDSQFMEKSRLLYSVKVQDSQIPVILGSSSSNSLNVKVGNRVQFECLFERGRPTPTITWFKNGHILKSNTNDSKVLLSNNNQTLVLNFTELEDAGNYVCNVSNRVGSAVSNKKLDFTDDTFIGGIVFSIVLTILVGVLLISYTAVHVKRKKKLKKELAEVGLLHFGNGAVGNWNPGMGIEEQSELIPYNKQWEFPREKLKLGKLLGSGAFGVVFKADAIGIIEKDKTTAVAVKMIKPNSDPSYLKGLVSELKIMIHVGRHLNVVNLLGAYTGNINRRELMVILEYCRFGNIQKYMLKQRDNFVNQISTHGYLDFNIKTISKNPCYVNVPNNTNLSEKSVDSSTQIGSDGYLVPEEDALHWPSNYGGDYKHLIVNPLCTHDLICWSFQVARGMEYLASKKILHGDLATRNILLAEENIVKICDFGFSKTMYNSDIYKKKTEKDRMPIKWLAIESLRDRVFSTQSDVWGFGIVLWEIFSLAVTPYPNIQNLKDLYHRLAEGYRMGVPQYANSEIYNIMLDCWKMNPMARPSFTDLAESLGDLLQDGTKSHFLNLNEVYMRMNNDRSDSTGYLSTSMEPTYFNCSSMSENILNASLNSSGHLENKDDLVLSPMMHNLV